MYKALGAKNIVMIDSKGVIHKGRTDLTLEKVEFALETADRTLADAMKGADMFLGLSKPGIVTKEMVASMNDEPIIFALANPTPEIFPEDVANTTTGQVQRSGKDISLTSTEYRLLCYLMMKSKWIVGKRELLTHVWQNENDVYDRVVDTYVCFLRRKIDKAFPHLPALIHTHKTRGYQVGLIHEKPKHH